MTSRCDVANSGRENLHHFLPVLLRAMLTLFSIMTLCLLLRCKISVEWRTATEIITVTTDAGCSSYRRSNVKGSNGWLFFPQGKILFSIQETLLFAKDIGVRILFWWSCQHLPIWSPSIFNVPLSSLPSKKNFHHIQRKLKTNNWDIFYKMTQLPPLIHLNLIGSYRKNTKIW